MISGEHSTLSREDREDLTAAAANADRRNTPTTYIVCGAIVLALGLILLVASWVSLSRSYIGWNAQSVRVTRIESLASQLESLRAAASDASNIKVHPPLSNMRTEIQRIATESGVLSVGLPKVNNVASLTSTARIVQYEYASVSDDSLKDLLEWVHNTTEQIPGMRVDTIKIRLTATTTDAENSDWKLDVTFARTEQI